jgi:hypothetical protein
MATCVEEYLNYGAATKKGLATPEILEMILIQVDIRTLLTSAQRVCHSWFDVISKSPLIQKGLFFTPVNDSEWVLGEKILNPLLIEAFPSIFPTKDRLYSSRLDVCDLPMTQDALTMDQFIRKDASWRKMLVQQPPLLGIGLFQVCSARGGDSAQSSAIMVSF